ncbi:MAG: FAD-dependent oxidoreductase, partial [Phycisphaerae bacterium]|nr:FAD-dependent oxidoreductase [Phycisphaerae bacterium]
MRFLRKALPVWHRQERAFLRRYEQTLAQVAYSTPAEYKQQLEALSSSRCLECMNPRCSEAGCPLEPEIPQWVELAYRNQWRHASELLHESNNFPEFTSRICPAPCEVSCKRNLNELPVGIRQIERQIVDRAFERGYVLPQVAEEASGKRVAIVGSGPAGLAAAQQLARAGHQVVVFEKEDRPGGLLRYGVPDFRLPKDLIDRRVGQLIAEGVTFSCSIEVGKDISARQLREQFDAILLATGAEKPRDLDIPGREVDGIHFALDFLRAGSGEPISGAVPT